MRAGKLDRTIKIQGFTNTVNEYGTPVETWTDKATLRAQIIQSSTEEFIRGGAVDETVIIFRTRWLASVTTSDRIEYEGEAFNIKETKEIGRRKGLELRAVRSE
ncbi:phage head closure protein [Shinella curvata]|uniref:Phage head closure protein n=1 Tax=Shinella curvata TaxID=1817964 RepID=A0ABT8XHL9_9HYPH|nr:phage head closure protein [Shinella curvata]MCJ8053892.1 phage head closure protein [Shinella curvata]MDO6123224.1 phage head closure protein [Shinella curvata]